jgi:hypothetical protein
MSEDTKMAEEKKMTEKKKITEDKKLYEEKKVADPFIVGFYESMAKTNTEKITKEIMEDLSEDSDDSRSLMAIFIKNGGCVAIYHRLEAHKSHPTYVSLP